MKITYVIEAVLQSSLSAFLRGDSVLMRWLGLFSSRTLIAELMIGREVIGF